MKQIKNFAELHSKDIPLVRDKNASLVKMFSELPSKGIKVPDGALLTEGFNTYRMIRFFPYKLIVLLHVLILTDTQSLYAQQNKQMFIFQIEGNNYIKKNYDKKGALINSQTFVVGKIRENKEEYLMSLKTYLYNKKGEFEDSTSTKYSCKPSDNKVLMNIFPFESFSSNKTVKVALSNGELYPENIVEGSKLDQVTFSAFIEGGAAGAFGSSTKIKIYDRQIVKVNDNQGTYHITSKIEIKAYLYGIKIGTISYLVEEIISKQKGILEQTFKKDTGEYFTIKLNNK